MIYFLVERNVDVEYNNTSLNTMFHWCCICFVSSVIVLACISILVVSHGELSISIDSKELFKHMQAYHINHFDNNLWSSNNWIVLAMESKSNQTSAIISSNNTFGVILDLLSNCNCVPFATIVWICQCWLGLALSACTNLVQCYFNIFFIFITISSRYDVSLCSNCTSSCTFSICLVSRAYQF